MKRSRAAFLFVIPAPHHSSLPRKQESTPHSWIPAYAGMTVGVVGESGAGCFHNNATRTHPLLCLLTPNSLYLCVIN